MLAGQTSTASGPLHSMRSQRSLPGLQTVSAGQSAILQPPPTAYAVTAIPVTAATTAGSLLCVITGG